MKTWLTRVPGRCGCCPCSRPAGTGRGRSWPSGWRCRPRTLRRDVDRLRELGYPIQAQRGVDGGYQLAAGTALPPLVVDDEEAVALAVGLQVAAQGAVEGTAEASMRALAKVIQVMPARLRRRVEALSAATVPASWASGGTAPPGGRGPGDPHHGRAGLPGRRAGPLLLHRGRRPADGPARGALPPGPARPPLVPGRLRPDRQDWRSFRLDRLAGARGTGARFRPRELPAADAAAFVRDGIGSATAIYQVEVLVDAPAGTVRERYGRWATVEAVSETRSRIRMTADQLEWPMMLLGSLGAEFEVISPPELLDGIRDWSRRFGRASLTSRGA